MTKKIACFILMLVLPVLTSAQEKPQTNDILFQRMLYIEGGYFTARRGDFRELYNSKITPAISLEFRKNRKFGYGVRLNFNYFDQDEAGLKIINLAAVPFINYSFNWFKNPRFVIGLGNGISYRRITISNLTSEVGAPLDLSISETEFSLLGLAMTGFDIAVSGRTALGFRVYFDYFYTGDPKLGDLGDTGGFHFMGRIGYRL